MSDCPRMHALDLRVQQQRSKAEAEAASNATELELKVRQQQDKANADAAARAAQLEADLRLIPWDSDTLAAELGCDRELAAGWAERTIDPPLAVCAWVARLAKSHRNNPPPPQNRQGSTVRPSGGWGALCSPRSGFEPCCCSPALRTILSPMKKIMSDWWIPQCDRVLTEFGAPAALPPRSRLESTLTASR
jgi:hypothetical protein